MTASECLHVLTAAIAARSEIRITTAHVVVFGTPLALHVQALPAATHRVARRHDRGAL